MKTFVVIAALALFVAVQAELTEEQKDKAVAAGKACIEETGVDPEDIKKIRGGAIVKNDKTKCFAKCFFTQTGFWKDGAFQPDVAIEKLSVNIDKDQIIAVVDACKGEIGSDDCDTAFKIYECGHGKGHQLL